MADFFHDYGALIAPTTAILNGFIAVLVAQFFKDHPLAKVLLVIAAGVLGSVAIGATFYSQRQIVAERDAHAERNKEIREQLGSLIQEGTALIAGCSDHNRRAPITETDEWLRKVDDFLNERIGHSYAQRLIMPVPNIITLSCNGANDEYNKTFRIVLGVNAHLEQFSQQPDF